LTQKSDTAPASQRGRNFQLLHQGRHRYRIDFTAPDGNGGAARQTKGGFLTREAAGDALLDARAKVKAGTHLRPMKVTVAGYMGEWLDGLRLRDTTVALYRRLNRLHVAHRVRAAGPALEMLDRLYGTLERGGLSLSTNSKGSHPYLRSTEQSSQLPAGYQ